MDGKSIDGSADEGKCWFKTPVFFQNHETPAGRTQGHSVDGIVSLKCTLKMYSADNASWNDYSRPNWGPAKLQFKKAWRKSGLELSKHIL